MSNSTLKHQGSSEIKFVWGSSLCSNLYTDELLTTLLLSIKKTVSQFLTTELFWRLPKLYSLPTDEFLLRKVSNL